MIIEPTFPYKMQASQRQKKAKVSRLWQAWGVGCGLCLLTAPLSLLPPPAAQAASQVSGCGRLHAPHLVEVEA